MTSKATGLGGQVSAWARSPTGPMTTHFWGPMANWGIVGAGILDSGKPADKISPNMTGVLCVYSALFMRFSLAIRPKNYLLFACHATNEVVQLNQLRRWYTGSGGSVAHAEAAPAPPQPKTKVVVLGSGWAAIPFIKGLSAEACQTKYDITVVSPRNYFLYSPLLPGAATGTVESRSIVDPVRKYISNKGVYYEAAASDIDPERQTVACEYQQPNCSEEARRFTVPYDVLVVAVGSITNTFNVPGVAENAYFLKSLEDAKKLRRRINQCFEMASLPQTSEAERRRLLTFVVVGGGPTGTELAAEMHDLVVEDMVNYFPKLKEYVAIRLIDTHDHILSALDRALSAYATQQFQRSGIELVLGCRVKGVEPDKVLVQQAGKEGLRQVEFGTCIWTTGIKMNPVTSSLCQKLPTGAQEHWRSLMTDPFLCVKGSHGSIFAMGDAATIAQEKALAHAAELFKEGDENGDGTLSCHELLHLMRKAKKRYPQLAEHAQRIQCGDAPVGAVGDFMHSFLSRKVAPSYDNVIATQSWCNTGDEEDESEQAAAQQQKLQGASLISPDDNISLEDFKTQLQTIDKSLRSLPATAQVANKQGQYLASLFNKHHIGSLDNLRHGVPATTEPFKYKHMGTLAYIGSDKAVMDPSNTGWMGPLQGLLIGWAWKGSETWMQISTKNMYLVSRDLLKAKIFGRDISDA